MIACISTESERDAGIGKEGNAQITLLGSEMGTIIFTGFKDN